MKLATLFSGIDGFSLAGDWLGWETVFTCEIDEFCNIILNHYKPNIPHYGNIKQTNFSIWRGKVDVLAGGFPCQPHSVAGKRLGKNDDRHIWPEMLRAIREISPRWVVGENVRGIISWNGGMVFNEVQSDLEAVGYEVTPYILPACAVNAPHRRDRTFFIAHRTDTGIKSLQPEWKNGVYGLKTVTYPNSKRQSSKEHWKKKSGFFTEKSIPADWRDFPTQSPVCNGDDGFSTELLRHRIRDDSMGLLSEKEIDKIISKAVTKVRAESIKAGGNAVAPLLIYQIFKAVEDYENNQRLLK
ncbi:DNA cytosine methyltransferase [Dysgonomonas sp. 521]|uniref:DNA cytosine methyltransferase n=1 Tax=Dysgonomonas sp. 521 TaxID=2302932 RepID=UPI0013D584D5|nr:DNA cytosine methyltransferase [Dysgonomonas sp. 521]NDV93498.1 DNA cytosine methyltransferase [Dysgonomonas sp. 521]